MDIFQEMTGILIKVEIMDRRSLDAAKKGPRIRGARSSMDFLQGAGHAGLLSS